MYNESFISNLTNISFNSTPNMSDFILPKTTVLKNKSVIFLNFKTQSTLNSICDVREKQEDLPILRA